MPAGLNQHALAGIDQYDGEVCLRGARCHVPGILLVSRCICDNEGPKWGGEEAIGDVDRDALLAFSFEPIDQECKIDFVTGGAMLLRVLVDSAQLIVEHKLGIMQQAADQRRLTVVDRSTKKKTQKILGTILGKFFGGLS